MSIHFIPYKGYISGDSLLSVFETDDLVNEMKVSRFVSAHLFPGKNSLDYELETRKIMAFDFVKQIWIPSEATVGVSRATFFPWFRLKTADGKEMKVTKDYEVFTGSKFGIKVPVQKLSVGDSVITSPRLKPVAIVSFTETAEEKELYSISTEANNLFLGGVLVSGFPLTDSD